MINIRAFIERIPWSIISVVLALFFGFFAVYYIIHEDKPNISFEIINETNVLDIRKPLKELNIYFQEEDIQRKNLNLKIFTTRIENNGSVDILQSYYDKEDIWGIQILNAEIIEVRLVDSNSDYLRDKISPEIIKEDKVKFKKVIFERKKYFILEILVLHPKSIQPEIVSMGKIAGINKIIPVEKMIKSAEKSLISKIFYGDLFIHFLRGLTYIILVYLVIIIIGVPWAFIYKLIDKKNIKSRKREIERIFGEEALKSNKILNMISNEYIYQGKRYINNLKDWLNDLDLLTFDVRIHKLEEEYGRDIRPDFSYIKFHRVRDDLRKVFLRHTRIKRLIKDGGLSLGDNNEVVVEKELKHILDKLISFLEEKK